MSTPSPTPDGDVACRIAQLVVYPVKSCAGVVVERAELAETGLDLDRQWMVVDEQGQMLTQRDVPRLALVRPTLRGEDILLRAPGMLGLHLRVDTVEAPTRATVWDDTVAAYDMGALAAQWFTDFLAPDTGGRRLRLVRFDPEHERLASRRWTGEIAARTGFADAFPLLVANVASLDDVNRRLAAGGHAPVTMARFRPNLVLEGLQPFDEDHVDELTVATAEGPVVLRFVKPCVRCTVPDVDPETAATGHAVGDTLASFRADPRVDGGLTFAMNAVVVSGFGHTLAAGQAVGARWAFD
jgi:uncharacterized protein YcbX